MIDCHIFCIYVRAGNGVEDGDTLEAGRFFVSLRGHSQINAGWAGSRVPDYKVFAVNRQTVGEVL